ncbi:Transmembrane protein 49 [Intoshia linei]|uniref:Transmembrane protein 49 n=1 Tax=Intoshia linei TaxID=1819745 RepID=A0A177AUK6_9BILA|nr:Transmembrane protein 49 [Intoshia linei]
MYWVGLGILSSVGFGFGLHTFVLYLGPYIINVTLAAYECNSVNFLEPPYPNEIICPFVVNKDIYITFWQILWKVSLESLFWGVGTAIGELPPYFMARAARFAGGESEELIFKKNMKWMDKMKYNVHYFVKNMGFPAIFLCASIPNPLFDLAGVTCGHFLVSFKTFFVATLLGKAIVKTFIQETFVIVLFSDKHLNSLVNLISKIPLYGERLKKPVLHYLNIQKLKLHNKSNVVETTTISLILNIVFGAMILYFIVSIVNALATRNLNKKKKKDM